MPRFAPSALACFSMVASSMAFNQVGSNLFGSPRFDASDTNNFGSAVSLTTDGLHLAVGATSHDADAASEGNGGIFLYNYTNSNWTLSTSIIGETGEGIGDRFSISDDASRVAVRRRPNGTDEDHVEVFEDGNLIGSQISNCAHIGNAVSISPNGNRVAVSCERANADAGLLEIFEWNGAQSNWDLMDTLDGRTYADNTTALFGWATSFDASGNRLAVSAVFQDRPEGDVTDKVGSARVFEYNSATTSWEPLGDQMFGISAVGRFGASLDLSGDGTTLAIGAPTFSAAEDVAPSFSGATVVFELDDSSSQWVLKGSPIQGEDTGDEFGRSVSISSDGSRFAASSGKHNSTRGQVRLFKYEANAWVQVHDDIEGLAAGDQFGLGITSIGLSGDGYRVASAGVGASNDNGVVTGRARVFDSTDQGQVFPSPSSIPSDAPSVAPVTPLPTSALGKFDWDLERTGNVTAAFNENFEEEEIALSYDIHLRTAVVSILDINCENSVGSGLVAVAQSTTPVSATHGELDVVLDIKQDSVVGSQIWRNGATTGNGFIDVCVRVDLVLDDGSATSVNFHEQKLYLSINLSQGFTVSTIDLDRDYADLDNQDVQVDYGLDSCQCNSTFDCVTEALVQGDDVYICIFSTDTNIEISTIQELDFIQDGVGGLEINAIDNTTEDALTAVLQVGKLAVIRSQMRSEFFDETAPGNVVASGSAAITFVNDAGVVRNRNLRVMPRKLEETDSTTDGTTNGFAVTMSLLSVDEGLDNTETGSTPRTGSIVGGVFGGLAVVALAVVAVVLRRKKDNDDDVEFVDSLGERAGDL